MSRLQIALKHRMLYASGDVLERAELALLLKDGSGNWQPQLFRVDPGRRCPPCLPTMRTYSTCRCRCIRSWARYTGRVVSSSAPATFAPGWLAWTRPNTFF